MKEKSKDGREDVTNEVENCHFIALKLTRSV